MHNFKNWLDLWVQEQKKIEPVGVRRPQFPDDPPDDLPDERFGNNGVFLVGDATATYSSGRFPRAPGVSEAQGPEGSHAPAPRGTSHDPARTVRAPGTTGDFSRFWMQHRAQPELYNLSLKAARCLLGAREKRFTGFLTIRDDLPSSYYLEVPFISRCWRLLWMLDEYEQGDHDGDVPAVAPIPARPGGSPGLSFSWSLIRDLDLNPATAQVTMRAMLELLIEADMLDPSADEEHYLTDRARGLIAAGSPGAFYKSFCIRVFNRCVWNRDDGLPPLVAIQLNGLYMLYVMHARFRGSAGRATTSARQLCETIDVLHRFLCMDEDSSFWTRDRDLMTRAIHFRFLNGIGRLLGLVESTTDGEEVPAPSGDSFFRPTPLAERIMLWNP